MISWLVPPSFRPAAASTFDVMVMPYADSSSATRSGRRSVATMLAGSQPARTSPDSTVSPMTPAPRRARRRGGRWGSVPGEVTSGPAPGEAVPVGGGTTPCDPRKP